MIDMFLWCPECKNGKHQNCDGWALDSADELLPCRCPVCPVGDS